MREESTDIVPLGNHDHSSVCSHLFDPTLLLTAPSMFGRDLIEQVRADAQGGSRDIPIIVEKCIEAVEVIGRYSACCMPAPN
jgi:hypothetical protein